MVEQLIQAFNYGLGVSFACCYFYQFVYIFIALLRGEHRFKPAKCRHHIAYLICAHNEERVISALIRSISQQDYPQDKISIFCVADNCSDNTAALAKKEGAVVFERSNTLQKGKSWAMQFGFQEILSKYPEVESIVLFDADNVLDPQYTARMNEAFDEGYEVVTSYRNSKNFASSWVSAAYALWFIREARFLNNARMICRTSCAVSGTGYMISRKILEKLGNWNFHLLTEDIEFSVWCACNNIRIAYAHRAEFFDEQPLSFKASWKQRMRWTKGFYQVFWHYGPTMLKSIGTKANFAAYDMLMTVAPAMILTLLSCVINLCALCVSFIFPQIFGVGLALSSLSSLGVMMANMYGIFFLLALITTVFEYKKFHGPCLAKFFNLFTFPIFMMSYIPLALVALVKRVEWVPTEHCLSKNFEEIVND